MTVVDTTIWIKYLRLEEPFFSGLDDLLFVQHDVLGVSAVFGELLRGIKGRREYRELIKIWEAMPKMDESDLFINAGVKSWRHQLREKGVGLIDVYILCAAEQSRSRIWTIDKRFQAVIPEHLLFDDRM